MVLNPDCVRDILLVVESKSDFGKIIEFPKDWPAESLEKFSLDELRYHLQQCYEAGLVSSYSKHFWDMGGNSLIRDLTPAGHEFIANMREDTIWNKTKSAAKSVGVGSLKALTDIAKQVVTTIISSQIG